MSQSAVKKRVEKSDNAFRTISEVSDTLDVQQHVLRFWETKFTQIKPVKRGGGRRYYRPEDIELLKYIQGLLYSEGYTIKGVQKLLKTKTKAELMQAAGVTASSMPAQPLAAPAAEVSVAPVITSSLPTPLVAVRSSAGAAKITPPVVSSPIPDARDAVKARQLRQRSILESMLGDLVELRDNVRKIREACTEA